MIASNALSELLPVGGAYLKFSLQVHAGQHAHDSALQTGTVWEMALNEEGLIAAEGSCQAAASSRPARCSRAGNVTDAVAGR